MDALELKIPPPIIGALIAAMMWVAARLTPALIVLFEGRRTLALVVAAFGVLCSGAGVLSFLRAHTTINPHHPDRSSVVVRSGLYRYTRNPMYVGLLLMLAGWAIWLSNIAALAGLPLFILYMNRFQIAPEERALQARFGQAYVDYARNVRRWI